MNRLHIQIYILSTQWVRESGLLSGLLPYSTMEDGIEFSDSCLLYYFYAISARKTFFFRLSNLMCFYIFSFWFFFAINVFVVYLFVIHSNLNIGSISGKKNKENNIVFMFFISLDLRMYARILILMWHFLTILLNPKKGRYMISHTHNLMWHFIASHGILFRRRGMKAWCSCYASLHDNNLPFSSSLFDVRWNNEIKLGWFEEKLRFLWWMFCVHLNDD